MLQMNGNDPLTNMLTRFLQQIGIDDKEVSDDWHPEPVNTLELSDDSVQQIRDYLNDERVPSLQQAADEMSPQTYEELRERNLEIRERWRQYVESETYRLDEAQPGYEVIELGDGFRKVTHKRLSVILDSNGWYNASKVCRENDLEFMRFANHPETQLLICFERASPELHPYDGEPYVYHETGDEETEGYYIPPFLASELITSVPETYGRRCKEIWNKVQRDQLF